jgi:CBS domain-containing protein
MKAKDIMNTTPFTISADSTIRELINLFNDRRVDGVCVVGEGNRLEGIVTLFELFQAIVPDYVKMKEALSHLVPEGYFEKNCRRVQNQPVRSIMKKNVVPFDEEDTLLQIIADITKHRLIVVPVLRKGVLVGMIHRKTLLSYAGKVCIVNTQ